MQKEDVIKMPELGEGVTEGELVKWRISLGDNIKTDQTVAEVMTDKAVMEIPSPVEGVVGSFLVKEGDTIPVGHNLLKLKSANKPQSVSQNPPMSQDQKAVTKPQKKSPAQSDINQSLDPLETNSALISNKEVVSPNTPDLSHIKASPSTRRWAKELKIDLSQVTSSLEDGRITQEDILQHLHHTAQKSPSQSKGQKQPFFTQGFEVPKKDGQERQALKGIRKKIAQKMQASKAVIPHFTLLESATVDQLEKLKSSVKENLKEKGIKVTYLAFVMQALLDTLKEYPSLNASIDDISQEVVYKNYYHFGFAVDTQQGLLVPVIKNVDQKSVAELSYEIQTLAEKSRQGLLQAEDMKEGTITITNIGSLGGEYATPIINAPESAILGMYRIFVKACWDGEQFVPKKTMNFSLTCDHRLIDGAVSARALKYFIHKIENPLSLFI